MSRLNKNKTSASTNGTKAIHVSDVRAPMPTLSALQLFFTPFLLPNTEEARRLNKSQLQHKQMDVSCVRIRMTSSRGVARMAFNGRSVGCSMLAGYRMSRGQGQLGAHNSTSSSTWTFWYCPMNILVLHFEVTEVLQHSSFISSWTFHAHLHVPVHCWACLCDASVISRIVCSQQ